MISYTGTYGLANLDATTCYDYVAAGANLELSQVGGVAAPAFNDVQAVGFVGAGGVSYCRVLQYDSFTATGVVPEPTTLDLTTAGFMALVARRAFSGTARQGLSGI